MFNFLTNSPENNREIHREQTDISNTVLDISSSNVSEVDNNLPEYTLSHIPENPDFIYLQDKLNKLFGFCMKTQNKKYKVHLCVYSINEDCVIEYTSVPFLQFLLCKSDTDQKWEFPCFEYECPIINDNGFHSDMDTDELDDITPPEQTHFENECFKQLLELLHININFHITENNNIIKNMYNGFIEYDDNNLVVVYNFTNNQKLFVHSINDTHPPFKPNNKFLIWKIIDDLLYKKQQEYNDMIVSFFKKFDYMKDIKQLNGDIIPYPLALYLCQYDENNNISNVLSDVILEQNHPFFKTGVYFSTNPIQPDNTNLTKYAVFIHNCLYILKDITEIDDETKQSYNNNIISASSYYFHENKLQLWGVKEILHFVEI